MQSNILNRFEPFMAYKKSFSATDRCLSRNIAWFTAFISMQTDFLWFFFCVGHTTIGETRNVGPVASLIIPFAYNFVISASTLACK